MSALGTTALVTTNTDGSNIGFVGGEMDARPFVVRFTTVGDAAYPTGGTSGLPAALAALCNCGVEILALFAQGLNLLSAVGTEVVWIPGSTLLNGKMALVLKSTGAELGNGVSAAACTFALAALCR